VVRRDGLIDHTVFYDLEAARRPNHDEIDFTIRCVGRIRVHVRALLEDAPVPLQPIEHGPIATSVEVARQNDRVIRRGEEARNRVRLRETLFGRPGQVHRDHGDRVRP